MAVYSWEGRSRAGEMLKGVMEAQAEPDVHARLRAQSISVVKIRKKAKDIVLPQFGSGVSEKDLVVFTRQLATMIDAGLPIVQCFDILASQTENKRFGTILRAIKVDLESGSSLSDGMKKHPKVFNDLFTNLVAAGEVGGILDRIFARLAGYIEKSAKLKSQIKGAMVYPLAILVVAIAVIILMLWKVIPIFEGMFKDMGGGALPAPTQVVINLSRGFQANSVLIMGSLFGFVTGFSWAMKTKRGRRIFDVVILRAPLFGPLLRKVAVARFSRTLGTLLAAGVSILEALDIVAKTAGNSVIADAVQMARTQVSEGKNMTEPLAESNVFPGMVVQMIAVGEQTGAMDTMLQKIADFYEEEVDVAVTSMTKLMEPLMMVFLGGICGGLLIAMYLPIFEMAGNIKSA